MIARRSRWMLLVSLLGCAAALLVALVEGPAASEAGGPAATAPPTARPVEVLALRTPASRTFRNPDGTYEARIAARPAAPRLRRDGHGDVRAATGATGATGVRLPARLARAARVTRGGRWVAFRLLGADPAAQARVHGAAATYAGALRDVDARYEVRTGGVKETLVLRSAAAPARYRYALTVAPGLTAKRDRGGAILVRDHSGTPRFWLPAPTVRAAGASAPTTRHVRYRLSANRRTLTVDVDRGWLRGARFPVEVDPTVYAGDDVSCTLASGSLASTSSCGTTTLKAGNDAGRAYRAALRFPDVGAAIPRNASVISAKLALYMRSQTVSAATTTVAAAGSGKPIGAGATWGNYDATHAWTTAGGDLVSDPQPNPTTLLSSYAGGWVTWDIARLAERWLREPSANQGLILKAADETAGNLITFDGHGGANGPNVAVTYALHPGYEPDQTTESVAFNAGDQLSVNAATGNAAVDSTDARVAGPAGFDLRLRRTYNSQDLGDDGTFGSGWAESVNDAGFVSDRVWYDDARTIYAYGHGVFRFDRDWAHDTSTTKAYISPPNLAATLTVAKSTGIGTLTFTDGTTWTYANSYDGNHNQLTRVADAAGHHIDLAPASGRPTRIGTITDANGAVLTFHYGSGGQLTTITDTTGKTWTYTTTVVNGHNLLTGYTAPGASTATAYRYLAATGSVWDRLDRITDTGGQRFTLAYGADGDGTQVTDVTQDFTDTRPDQISHFDYTPASGDGHSCATASNLRTVLTDAQARETTYCSVPTGQVVQTWRPWDTAPANATTAAGWTDAHEGYVSGTGTHPVVMAALDGASGVRRIVADEVGKGTLASVVVPCPPRTTLPQLCPALYTATLNVPTGALSEGAHSVQQTSVDLAGGASKGPTTTIRVDRTPPGTPSSFLSSYDDSTQSASVAWDVPADPALADGSAGSGVGSFSFRTRIGSGAWSAWQTTDDASTEVTGVASASAAIGLEVRAIDWVGNASATTAATVTAGSDPTDDAVLTLSAATSYQEEFGGTMATAITWMQGQARAVGAEDAIGALPGNPGFVAVWHDNVNRRVKVNVTASADRTAIAQVLDARGMAGSYDFVTVTATIHDLDVARDAATPPLQDLVATGALQIGRRSSSDALVFTLSASATAAEEQRVRTQAAALSVPTVVERSDETTMLADVMACNPTTLNGDKTWGCDPPLRGGIRIEGHSDDGTKQRICTSGFLAQDKTSNAVRLLTAGHCAAALGGVDSYWYGLSSSPDNEYIIGDTVAGTYGPGGDFASIAVSSSSYKPWVYFDRSTTGSVRRTAHYRIIGTASATALAQAYSQEGVQLCFMGATAGSRCGRLTDTDRGVSYDSATDPFGGQHIDHVGVIKTCGSRKGDSGAGLVRAHKAVGILSGSSKKKCNVYFQSVPLALDALNAKIFLG